VPLSDINRNLLERVIAERLKTAINRAQ